MINSIRTFFFSPEPSQQSNPAMVATPTLPPVALSMQLPFHPAIVTKPNPPSVAPSEQQRPVTQRDIQEFIALKIQEFLRPYLRRQITLDNENAQRASLPSQILPQLKVQFQTNAPSDSNALRYMLSAYLEKCAYACLPIPPRIRQSALTRDEMQRDVNQIIPDFTRALEHSLRIDFKELNLNDKEIESLARWGIHHTPIFDERDPLPEDWRQRHF